MLRVPCPELDLYLTYLEMLAFDHAGEYPNINTKLAYVVCKNAVDKTHKITTQEANVTLYLKRNKPLRCAPTAVSNEELLL